MRLFSSPNNVHPPSQYVLDTDGSKWRLCAGCAVFNSRNELLIGERIGKQGSWQAPQGGVDATVTNGEMETVAQAAARELFEEVGLETGKHVLLETLMTPMKCRYKTEGTKSWLEKAGFAGQELNWIAFRCADSGLETDPNSACNLSGLNGEAAEFSSVKWKSLDWVIENVWEAKRGPYEALRDGCVHINKNWEDRCAQFDLSGKWYRDSTRSEGLKEALMARGISEETAIKHAEEPYVQKWQRLKANGPSEFKVITYDRDTGTIRRELIYPIGKFKEVYEGKSMLFGGSDGGLIERQCFYCAEQDADDKIAHVTMSITPRGKEESRRFVRNGELVLRRSFWHSWRTDKIVSTEVFVKCLE
jgi:putative (di)nucleoside polyphosphate hydrolase